MCVDDFRYTAYVAPASPRVIADVTASYVTPASARITADVTASTVLPPLVKEPPAYVPMPVCSVMYFTVHAAFVRIKLMMTVSFWRSTLCLHILLYDAICSTTTSFFLSISHTMNTEIKKSC